MIYPGASFHINPLLPRALYDVISPEDSSRINPLPPRALHGSESTRNNLCTKINLQNISQKTT